MTSQGRHTG